MELLDLEFKRMKEKLVVSVTADLSSGWRQLKHSYGFFESMQVDYPGDRRLRIQVEVYRRPGRHGSSPASFPQRVHSAGHTDKFVYTVSEGKLLLATFMEIVESCVLPRSGGLGFYEAPIEIAQEGDTTYSLKLLVVLSPPQPPKPPVIIEWDTLPFFPGELPGLGKKR